ncbi:Imm51 family immunity protein [Cytophagaceae bacterium DM2B3-1]|uniref:Imm51 family immunity protein n=1 Tax=Xanthocytophaga flava TaxID=3048013 RepID=A0ABT7CDB5_9BACT|nr:Imm51 family immunity protein [Xanthocytophaga flavus]MDJ1471655.1 Imm51 family immunity protein [Xanthocytophaga flavus]MDJ1491698.1 Imm51 family immunity protein [Xanthocytophaga flavus]
MRNVHDEGWDDSELYPPFSLTFIKAEIMANNEPCYGVDTSYDLDGEYEDQIKILENAGLDVSGYTWEVLIANYIERKDPAFLEDVNFDSEGSTFACSVNSEEKQTQVVRLIYDLLNDTLTLQELATAISESPDFNWLK